MVSIPWKLVWVWQIKNICTNVKIEQVICSLLSLSTHFFVFGYIVTCRFRFCWMLHATKKCCQLLLQLLLASVVAVALTLNWWWQAVIGAIARLARLAHNGVWAEGQEQGQEQKQEQGLRTGDRGARAVGHCSKLQRYQMKLARKSFCQLQF